MAQGDLIQLLGYSERGMIWSLFTELSRREDGLRHLGALLSQTTGRGAPLSAFDRGSATILIEQSFSEFGDADVVILLDDGTRKQVVFLEAKVKTQRKNWTIEGELRKHEAHPDVFSNLFVQLYAKQRLVEALVPGGGDIHTGVDFLQTFGRRKIGKNRVVLDVVKRLRDHVDDATYVALLPELDGLEFEAKVKRFEEINQITCTRWRSLSWAQVKDYCDRSELSHSLQAFKFNAGQIY